jgi:intracellular sulfur oxidation DsrE/DsrF family protein
MKRRAFLVAGLLLAALLNTGSRAAGDPIKVVYQFSEGEAQAVQGLRNIKNHLNADPKAKIVAVSYADGINFLLDGATDKNGYPFQLLVQDLKAKGVEFDVCDTTLTNRKIDKSKVIPEAKIVPSGVVEIARLQAREGYVYLKP